MSSSEVSGSERKAVGDSLPYSVLVALKSGRHRQFYGPSSLVNTQRVGDGFEQNNVSTSSSCNSGSFTNNDSNDCAAAVTRRLRGDRSPLVVTELSKKSGSTLQQLKSTQNFCSPLSIKFRQQRETADSSFANSAPKIASVLNNNNNDSLCSNAHLMSDNCGYPRDRRRFSSGQQMRYTSGTTVVDRDNIVSEPLGSGAQHFSFSPGFQSQKRRRFAVMPKSFNVDNAINHPILSSLSSSSSSTTIAQSVTPPKYDRTTAETVKMRRRYPRSANTISVQHQPRSLDKEADDIVANRFSSQNAWSVNQCRRERPFTSELNLFPKPCFSAKTNLDLHTLPPLMQPIKADITGCRSNFRNVQKNPPEVQASRRKKGSVSPNRDLTEKQRRRTSSTANTVEAACPPKLSPQKLFFPGFQRLKKSHNDGGGDGQRLAVSLQQQSKIFAKFVERICVGIEKVSNCRYNFCQTKVMMYNNSYLKFIII